MRNRQALMDVITRAESGPLLPGEAQLLREAVEALADMTDTVQAVCDCQGVSCPTPVHEASEGEQQP